MQDGIVTYLAAGKPARSGVLLDGWVHDVVELTSVPSLATTRGDPDQGNWGPVYLHRVNTHG